MIKKNKQGMVVEYEYEAIHAHQREQQAKEKGTVVSTASTPARCSMTEADIDAEYEAAVAKAQEETQDSLKQEMSKLEERVSTLIQSTLEKKREARERRAKSVLLAKQAVKVIVLDTEAICVQEIQGINRQYYADMDPLNAEALEVKKTIAASLETTLVALAERRKEQYATLAESKRLDAKVKAVLPAGESKSGRVGKNEDDGR